MQEQIDGEAVQQIERLVLAAAQKTIEIDGVEYATTQLFNPRKPEPEPKPIELSTLSSLCDFVTCGQDMDYTEERGRFVHVASPTLVRLCTGIFGEFNQRAIIAEAKSPVRTFSFGTWMPQDAFVIGLQTCFVEGAGRDELLRFVSSTRDEAVRTSDDDGVSQVVTAKRGVAMVREVTVKNPHMLKPFRTFVEVGQPLSPYILRVRNGATGAPEFSLWECDGGAWQVEAVSSILDMLRRRLPETVKVYG